MIPQLLLYKIMQFFVVMILGFVLVKLKVVKSGDSTVLSKICLYLLMPANIISAFSVELTDQVKSGLILAFCVAIALHIVFLGIDIIYKKVFKGVGVERASIMYSNAGNLIIPIVMFVLGNEWVIYSCAFLSVQLAFMWTHGVRLFSKDEKFNFKKIFLNVNLIAIAVGAIIMVCGIRLPKFASEITTSLGGMIGNISMLIAGMTIAQVDVKKMVKNKRLYLVTAMRMIVIPFIALALLKLVLLWIPLSNAENVLLISFLATMTPAAASIMQLAQVYDNGSEFAVSVNAVTTLVSIATMPMFVALYFL